jgi:hypothetical protein
MRDTITEARKNFDTAISAMLKIVENGDGDSRRLHEVEVRLWSLLLALGRSLIALYLSRRASRIQSGFYEHNRGRYFISKGHGAVRWAASSARLSSVGRTIAR